jgi:hypothetical protein
MDIAIENADARLGAALWLPHLDVHCACSSNFLTAQQGRFP